VTSARTVGVPLSVAIFTVGEDCVARVTHHWTDTVVEANGRSEQEAFDTALKHLADRLRWRSEPLRDLGDAVITDGWDCYRRIRPGVFKKVDRQGRGAGAIHSGFTPRPRWKRARKCWYDARTSLTCVHCGCYDTHYAMTGERSYCMNQGKGVVG
jgi:hypothetical protein